MVVVAVVATEESAPAKLEIKTPLVTLIDEPVNELAATVPSVRLPAPCLVTVHGPPDWVSAPRVSVPVPTPLLATSKVALPENVVAPSVRP